PSRWHSWSSTAHVIISLPPTSANRNSSRTTNSNISSTDSNTTVRTAESLAVRYILTLSRTDRSSSVIAEIESSNHTIVQYNFFYDTEQIFRDEPLRTDEYGHFVGSKTRTVPKT